MPGNTCVTGSWQLAQTIYSRQAITRYSKQKHWRWRHRIRLQAPSCNDGGACHKSYLVRPRAVARSIAIGQHQNRDTTRFHPTATRRLRRTRAVHAWMPLLVQISNRHYRLASPGLPPSTITHTLAHTDSIPTEMATKLRLPLIGMPGHAEPLIKTAPDYPLTLVQRTAKYGSRWRRGRGY